MLNLEGKGTSDLDKKYVSELSKMSSFTYKKLVDHDRIPLTVANSLDLLPESNSLRLANPCKKIVTFCDYSASCNFSYSTTPILRSYIVCYTVKLCSDATLQLVGVILYCSYLKNTP